MQCSPELELTFTASGAVGSYRCVGFAGAQATAQGQKVAGVARYGVAAGEPFPVIASGTAIIEAGGNVSVGDSLISDSQGRAIKSTGEIAIKAGVTAVTSAAAHGNILIGGDMPEFVFGDALMGASAAGNKIEVLLRR
ncbi:Lipoprotein [uncultured Gammaproteobacteria bacterium]